MSLRAQLCPVFGRWPFGIGLRQSSLPHFLPAAALVLLLLLAPAAAAFELAQAEERLLAGRYEKAASLASAAIEKGVWNEAWWRLKIEADLATGFYDDARETLESGLRRYRSSIRLRLLGHEVYRFSNLPDRAAKMLDEIDELVRRSPWRYSDRANRLALGRFLLLQGADGRQVLELIYDRVKQEHPEYVDAFLASADLALLKEDYALAAEELEKVLARTPDHPEIHFRLARAFFPSDVGRGEKHLERTLAQNPNHAGALLLRADHFIDAERYDACYETLDKVLAFNASHPQAWAYRAVLVHLAGDAAQEQVCRRRALCTWPDNPEVDHTIGRKLSEKYRFAEGAAYQRAALELDPDYLPAKMQLAQDLLRLGEEDEGWRLAEQVNREDGYNVLAHNLVTLHESIARFRTLERDGFIVRMDAREAAIYGRDVLDLLEEAKQVLGEKYQIRIDRPVIVEVFPQQKDFAIRTFGLPGGAGFLGVCFGRVITMNSPASKADNPTNWRAVLWHEFCHTVTLEKTRNRMPRWLSEGISVYEERQHNPAWGQAMNPRYREMILKGQLTPVSRLSGAFLNPASPLHLQFAYFESSLVVEYLVQEYGLTALLRILDDLGVGMPINDALARHAGGSLAALDAEFAAFAQQRAAALAPGADWDDPPEIAEPGELAEWVEQHPNHITGLKQFAAVLIEQGDWQAAKKPLEQLVELFPTGIGPDSAYRRLARVHRELGEVERERRVLEELARQDADDLASYRRLIGLARAEQDWQAVARNAERMLAVDPLQREPHEQLAVAAERLGNYERAIRASRAALLLEPIDPAAAHLQLARLLHHEEKLQAARRAALQALEEAPRYRAAHRLLLAIVREARRRRSPPEEQDAVIYEGAPPEPALLPREQEAMP